MTRSGRIAALFAILAAAAKLLPADKAEGFGVAVLVDGKPAPEYAGRGRIYIEALKGKEFVIRLSNPTSRRGAVALSVDGRNVVDAKRTTALDASKWVLSPGQTADIPGWQISGQTARKFFFTETSKSYARWLGDTSNVGVIEAVFYREKLRGPALADKKDEAESFAGSAGEARQKSASAPSSPMSSPRETDRFAATGIGDKTDFAVQWVAFEEDPVPAARIAIRYEFRPELVRLGVLPREDELYARDRSQGFQHEYAPDPYRQR
jgi:hypothetical protein